MPYECFADEIAIDFPSVGRVVDRMRDSFLGERRDADVLRADVTLSLREAFDGALVPIDVPVSVTCPNCGGRGETWTEPCALCDRTGASIVRHVVRVPVPPRIADGACVRVRLRSRDASSVLVEVHVAICN
jgi:DnaJ-class molecular chaperone